MGWSVEDMLELGRRHARLEEERRLDPLMETLVAEPAYQFHPLGVGMVGGELVRRYYAQFFTGFMQHIAGYVLLDEWVNENAVTQEYDITTLVDGVRETHRVVGILFCADAEAVDGRRLLGGERIYASERCIRLMAGDLFEELVPLPADG